MATHKLPPGQQRFLEELLLEPLNHTAAYRKAYPKCKSDEAAGAAAARLLGNVRFQEALAVALAARSQRTEITQDYVLKRLKENVERAMQAEPVRNAAGDPTGEYRYEGAVANKALELLGKHLGMFKERVELTGANGGPVRVEFIEVAAPPAPSES